MVMKIGCEVKQQLVVTIAYDDNTTKTIPISEGDYVTMAYNKNGVKNVITGTVITVHANPYNGQVSRNDWYVVVSNDRYSAGCGEVASARINIINILDVTLIHSSRDVTPINTPNTEMRVTDIRVKDGFLQISQNWGESWLTVGVNSDGTLSDDFVGEDKSIEDKIHDMIGSDNYASSEEFINGVIEIIHEEVAKQTGCNCRVSSCEEKAGKYIKQEG